jgi:hypothetical protein
MLSIKIKDSLSISQMAMLMEAHHGKEAIKVFTQEHTEADELKLIKLGLIERNDGFITKKGIQLIHRMKLATANFLHPKYKNG